VEAREAFVTGRYQQALDLFGKLYAETLHPTYLRNIGRCYQGLGDADHAVSAFRDYLRKVPQLSAKERAEIDEYIAEMEALKRKQEEQARAAGPGPAPAARPDPGPPPLAVNAAALAPAAPAEKAGGTRWWLWTGLAVVAAGAAIAAGVILTRPADASCPMGSRCYRP
jgi:hypothetical protein